MGLGWFDHQLKAEAITVALSFLSRRINIRIMQKEIWVPVVEYEGLYEVSTLGNVKSLCRKVNHWRGGVRSVPGRTLKTPLNNNGYKRVSLCLLNSKKAKTRTVHQLVAEAFLNHNPKKSILVVNHKNLIKTDNNVSNLEIVTVRENSNLKHIKSASAYVGVTWMKNSEKWRARIHVNRNRVHLGCFNSELEAANAYEKAKQKTCSS